MWRGRQALADGKYAAAIENFNILERLDTTDYWSFFFRGIAKYNLGDLRGANRDFDRSVRLNPVFTNGYHYRAITQSRFGNYDAAFRDFDKAIEEAIRFAEKDGHTLVIISADHETGGTVMNYGVPNDGFVMGTFTSKGHTPMMVPLFAYGPKSYLFQGVQENSDVSNKIFSILSGAKTSR